MRETTIGAGGQIVSRETWQSPLSAAELAVFEPSATRIALAKAAKESVAFCREALVREGKLFKIGEHYVPRGMAEAYYRYREFEVVHHTLGYLAEAPDDAVFLLLEQIETVFRRASQ